MSIKNPLRMKLKGCQKKTLENDEPVAKNLAKLPVGTKVLYEQNPDSDKTKRPKWCKGTIKKGPIQESMKF